jgi:hypothetical protein
MFGLGESGRKESERRERQQKVFLPLFGTTYKGKGKKVFDGPHQKILSPHNWTESSKNAPILNEKTQMPLVDENNCNISQNYG